MRAAWWIWCAAGLHLMLIGGMQIADDDTVSSWAALGSFLICAWVFLVPLRLGALAPASIYLAVLGVFHLGLVVPRAMGWAGATTPGWLLRASLTPALTLTVLSFASLLVGAGWAARRLRIPSRPEDSGSWTQNVVLFRCGWALTCLGLASLLWGLRELGFDRVAQANHFETYRLAQTYDPRFFVTSLQLTPMGLYLALAAAPRRGIAPTAAVGLAWAVGIFLLGFRGFALTPVLTALALLRRRGTVLPRWAWAAAALLLLAAIPAVRQWREQPLAQRTSADLLVASGPLDALQEMGGSLRPLVHTIDLLADEPYRWGRTYLRALSQIVPNLDREWRGAGYLPVEQLPPSQWVTRLAAPWNYRNYGGLGFSAVAEPYMNFGVAGVPLFFAGLGVALVWADRWGGSRPTRLAAWAVVLGPLLWSARNSMGVFVRPAVWGLAAVLAARLLADALAARRRLGVVPGVRARAHWQPDPAGGLER